MSKKFSTFVFLVLLMAGCGTAEPEITEVTRIVEVPSEPQIMEVTRIVEVASEPEIVEVTRVIEVEKIVEVTRVIEVTAVPTEEPTPVPITDVGNIIANNYVTEFTTEGGFTIRIVRFLVGDKTEIEQRGGNDFSRYSGFSEVDTVGEIIFEIINDSNETITAYPDQGSIQIGSELINLLDSFLTRIGEDISGDIFPGIRLVGGQWFPIKRSAPGEVSTVIFRMSGLRNNSSRITEDIEITFDLEPIFEPLPDDLLN